MKISINGKHITISTQLWDGIRACLAVIGTPLLLIPAAMALIDHDLTKNQALSISLFAVLGCIFFSLIETSSRGKPFIRTLTGIFLLGLGIATFQVLFSIGWMALPIILAVIMVQISIYDEIAARKGEWGYYYLWHFWMVPAWFIALFAASLLMSMFAYSTLLGMSIVMCGGSAIVWLGHVITSYSLEKDNKTSNTSDSDSGTAP